MAKAQVLTDDEDTKEPAEELVVVEKKPEPPKPDDDDDEDDHPAAEEKDVNPDDPDDKEREAIRERRRLEKIERKERREKAIARDKLELEFLSKRNAELERRFNTIEQRQHQADVNNVDVQLREAINEFDMAEKVIAKAVAAGNGDDVAQAMRYRDQAMAKAQQLKALKDQASQRTSQPPANQMDDVTLHYAKEFVKENSWYDPQGRNEESAVVLAIDQTLVRDGFKPNTSEYWDELRKRAARRLPEKFKPVESDTRQARGGPAVGSGREHAPSSTRKEVYISPERKAALVEAGVWDDNVLRAKYVKRYMQYDRDNKS